MPEDSGPGADACGAGPPGEEDPFCGAPQKAQKGAPSFREALHVEHLVIALIREQYTPRRPFAQRGAAYGSTAPRGEHRAALLAKEDFKTLR